MEEIWKDIDGYEGYYQISNLGRVKSLGRNIYRKSDGKFSRYKPESIKIPVCNTDGYPSIKLCVNGENKTYRNVKTVEILYIMCKYKGVFYCRILTKKSRKN